MWNFLIPKDKFAKWEQTRAKGFGRFALVSGLYFGLTFAFLFSLLQIIVPVFDSTMKLPHFFETESFIRFLAMCLVGGFFWSITVWYLTEHSYRKYLNNKESDK